jgi:aminoglycoside phosphotransferase family enzyme
MVPFDAAQAAGLNLVVGAPVQTIFETSTCNLILAGPNSDSPNAQGTVTKVWKDSHVIIPDLGADATRREYLMGEMQIGVGIQSGEAYLGVSPVCVVNTPEAGLKLVEMPTLMPGLGGDWGLQMVQFPQDQRWDHRLERGEIKAAEEQAVVAKIVDFHLGLPPSEEANRIASPENFDQTVRARDFGVMAACGVAPAAELEALNAHEHKFLTERADLMRTRIEAGNVRDGHGDTKLTNTYMPGGLVLDGISFYKPWSCNDVLADVAYNALGFALGDPQHFESWLAAADEAYSPRTAEHLPGNPALHFYLNYRAWVEAKVAGLEGRIDDAQQLLALANNNLQTAFTLAGLEW